MTIVRRLQGSLILLLRVIRAKLPSQHVLHVDPPPLSGASQWRRLCSRPNHRKSDTVNRYWEAGSQRFLAIRCRWRSRHRRALTEMLVDKIVIAPYPHKIDKDGRRHYLIRAIPYQDPQQEAGRL